MQKELGQFEFEFQILKPTENVHQNHVMIKDGQDFWFWSKFLKDNTDYYVIYYSRYVKGAHSGIYSLAEYCCTDVYVLNLDFVEGVSF